jgi:hypothetical protein
MKKILIIFATLAAFTSAYAAANEKCTWETKSDKNEVVKHYGRTERVYDERSNYTHDECVDEEGARNKRTWEKEDWKK